MVRQNSLGGEGTRVPQRGFVKKNCDRSIQLVMPISDRQPRERRDYRQSTYYR